jgi:hypothetical protein
MDCARRPYWVHNDLLPYVLATHSTVCRSYRPYHSHQPYGLTGPHAESPHTVTKIALIDDGPKGGYPAMPSGAAGALHVHSHHESACTGGFAHHEYVRDCEFVSCPELMQDLGIPVWSPQSALSSRDEEMMKGTAEQTAPAARYARLKTVTGLPVPPASGAKPANSTSRLCFVNVRGAGIAEAAQRAPQTEARSTADPEEAAGAVASEVTRP